ncbi:MAG: redoxin family protein [Candidatus Stahlbacteria bacterium]|nr:redoxin family protein [Candidatus Stahlbacteria bacterium]
MKKVYLTVVAVWLGASILLAGPGPGSPAPNFTLPDTALVNHSLTEFTGKVVLLNFWTSW